MSALIQLLWMLWLASMEARSDFDTIKNGLPVYHVNVWLWRAGCALALAAALAIHAASWWMLAHLLVLSYGAFTPAFRFMLNKRRGKDWRYISPSNRYDFTFIYATWFGGLSRSVSIGEAKEYHQAYYVPSGRNDQYQPAVHRAGFIAYAVEVLALVIGIYITTI
jgi:hypothetical protein